MATQILMRRGTAAQWVAANPTLAEGEQGVELDTGRSKIGNGTAAWNALAYPVISPTDLAYTASAVGGTLTSSTGSDTVIPLAGGVNAGLMTAAEKTKLANISGSNTGDQDLSGKQDVLVSASNIKTINGTSLLGSGDVTISSGAGGSAAQVQYNSAGALAGDSGLVYDATSKALTVGGGTVTTSAPVISGTQTWNASGTTFTGLKLNVTDTASADGSLLMDLQVSGVSRFGVDKTGTIKLKNGWTLTSPSIYEIFFNSQTTFSRVGFVWGYEDTTILLANQLSVALNLGGSRTVDPIINFGSNLTLTKDAANTLAQRNGTNAQTSRTYGTYTDASNYRRLSKTMSAAGVAEIKPEGAGTGAAGNVLHISGLPTSNPGAGILWNDAGTVKVGT